VINISIHRIVITITICHHCHHHCNHGTSWLVFVPAISARAIIKIITATAIIIRHLANGRLSEVSFHGHEATLLVAFCVCTSIYEHLTTSTCPFLQPFQEHSHQAFDDKSQKKLKK
jgi:hypothetical protein